MAENVPSLNGNGSSLQDLEPMEKAKEVEKSSFDLEVNGDHEEHAKSLVGVAKEEEDVDVESGSSSGSVSEPSEVQDEKLSRADANLSEVSSRVEETSDEDDESQDEEEDTPRTPVQEPSEGEGDEEEEENGSIRRSTRSRRSTSKYVNYQDQSSMSELESDYSGKGEGEDEPEEATIEKFIARKPANKALMRKCVEKDEQYGGAYLYLCKYKKTSYLHLKWLHEDDVRQMDWRLASRLQRFATKAAAEEDERSEEMGWTGLYEEIQNDQAEFYDPELTEVDRILAEKREIFEENESSKQKVDLTSFTWLEGQVEGNTEVPLKFLENQRPTGVSKVLKTLYLIKWCGQSYADSTWEFADDIKDDLKLALFRRRNRPPVGLADGGKNTFESSEMTELNTALWPALGANSASISPILRIKTKAKVTMGIPPALKDFIMQGEVSGVLPGDEIIAVGDVSVQGKKLGDATSHIRAQALESRKQEGGGFILTFRRFVKRRDHLPVETALYNLRFSGTSSLGLMLKSFDAEGTERPVARHAEAIKTVFVEDVLTPRYYAEATKGDTVLFSSRWLRHAVMPYLLARAAHTKNFTFESIVDSCGVPKADLEKWLRGWKNANEVDEIPSDTERLYAVEKKLWEWVQNATEIYGLCTYGLVEDERLEQMLRGKSVEYYSKKSKVLKKALSMLKTAELIKKQEAQAKTDPKRKQPNDAKSDGSQKALDKAKMHHLIKVDAVLNTVVGKIEADHSEATAEDTPVDINIFTGSSLGTAQENQVQVFRYMERVVIAVAWLRVGSKAMFTSWMPLPEQPFVGMVDINQQRDLQRQEMQLRALEKPAAPARARLPHKKDGWRYQQRYIARLRNRQFVPYTARTHPRYKHNHTLRSYQLQGVNWLLSRWYTNRSCILADEMGLGKTVQVVAMLEHMRTKENMRGPFLVIAPLSTIGHWHREIEGWTDMNLCKYYDSGGATGREKIREYEFWYPGYERRVDMIKFNVMVTTYETFMADVDYLMELPWLAIVVDEGHRLRSVKSKLLEMLKKITNSFRLLLTGTPLQNNMQELWSLLNFCDRDAFRSKDRFLDEYGDLQSKEQLDELQSEIAPYILRRVKEDVEKSIPPKEETIIDIELTMLQKRYYRAIYDKNRQVLYKGCKANNKPQLINVEMELRKCCNHPYMVAGVKERELKKLTFGVQEKLHEIRSGGGGRSEHKHFTRKQGDVPLDEMEEDDALVELGFDLEKAVKDGKSDDLILDSTILERTVRSSGKLVLVDKLLPKLKAEGHKVLIFSQMKKMLDILESYCIGRRYGYERLDGSIQGNLRQDAIDRFCNPETSSFVFLLSTRAGGVGINLTAADTVIIFDSDWNPQNDAQAQARCHRIGQKKAVRIYRLVTKKTYEETMLQRAAMKLGLERAVLGGVGKSSGIKGSNMTPKELEKMLRKGAYHHLDANNEEGNAAAKSFCEADIEDLLKTNSRTIQVNEITGQISMPSLTHNTVKKQSFNVAEGKEEDAVDVDDPDFWKKVLPDETSPDSLLSKLNDAQQVSALSNSSKARRAYMISVRTIVRELLDLRESGEVVNEHEMETTCSLLIQIANMRNVFKKDTFQVFLGRAKRQRKPFVTLATKWLNLLEASRERRARRQAEKRKRDGKHGRSTEDSSDDELYSTGDEKPAPKPAPAEIDYAEFVEEESPPPLKKARGRKKSSAKSTKSKNRTTPKGTPRKKPGSARKKRGRPKVVEETIVEPPFDPRVLQEDYMMKDFTTEVCAICADGGSLVCCEGQCKRAFHLPCLNLPTSLLDEDADWYCPDCESGKQSCMFCGEGKRCDPTRRHDLSCLFKAGEQDSEVHKCSDPTCGRFFHVACLGRSDLVEFPNGAEDRCTFVCPLHTCRKCNGKTNVSVQCIRCPNAYHSRCLDRTNTLRLHLNLIICHKHLNGRKFDPETHANFEPNRELYASFGRRKLFNGKERVKVKFKFDDNLWEDKQ